MSDVRRAVSTREQTVAEAMISTPDTHGVEISLAEAAEAFANTHVHMLLLTRDGILHGTLVRDDLLPGLDPQRPAISLATLSDRTVGPESGLADARCHLDRSATRRLAVTDANRRLLGLLCLKQSRHGFCTEADILDRPQAAPLSCIRHRRSA